MTAQPFRLNTVASTLRVEFFSEPSRSESTTWSPRSAWSLLGVVSTLCVEFFSEPSRSESTTWSPRSAWSL
ncbi:MAG: hypothetical protein O3B01_28275, partial [Planctomycetota bacterium]|nr:hypothetical protein [Planctomycetota bacterium]